MSSSNDGLDVESDRPGVLDGPVGRWLRVAVRLMALGVVGLLMYRLPAMFHQVEAASPAWLWPLVSAVIVWVFMGMLAVIVAIHGIVVLSNSDDENGNAMFVFAMGLFVIFLFLSGCATTTLPSTHPKCNVAHPFVVPDGCRGTRMGTW